MPRSAYLLVVLVILLASCNMPVPTLNAPVAPETPRALPVTPESTAQEPVVTPESPLDEPAPPEAEEMATEPPAGRLPEPTVEVTEAPAILPPDVLSATLTISDTAPILTPGLPLDWEPLATLQAAPPSLVADLSGRKFRIQPGTPAALPNFTHPESGCEWMGVAGQVFLADETPAVGLVVEVRGALQGKNVLSLAVTGGASLYGPGGYEIRLADQPVGTTLTLRLFNVDGVPLASPMLFQTSNSCDENLLLVNLIEQPEGLQEFYLPLVNRQSYETFLPGVQNVP